MVIIVARPVGVDGGDGGGGDAGRMVFFTLPAACGLTFNASSRDQIETIQCLWYFGCVGDADADGL